MKFLVRFHDAIKTNILKFKHYLITFLNLDKAPNKIRIISYQLGNYSHFQSHTEQEYYSTGSVVIKCVIIPFFRAKFQTSVKKSRYVYRKWETE